MEHKGKILVLDDDPVVTLSCKRILGAEGFNCREAHVFVVAAGREGTLPAVVAGLVDRPVIGVPVSTGYGYMGKGKAALASMLQSCSVLAVVNIDAGFTAGAMAARIANMVVEQ